MCLGPGPMPIGAENARSTIQEVRKVALGPSAAVGRPHTFACCALQPFSCFPFFLSRAAALDAASSGAAAAIQCCFSWEQPLFVAARRHRRCLAAVQRHARRVSKRSVCGLRQVRSLRLLIRARTTSISACQTMLFRCASADSTPGRLCRAHH